MGGRRLAVNIVLPDPETRTPVHFSAGATVPGWAAALITNPECWDRSDGGPVPTDRPYVVGEHGPEAFLPAVAADMKRIAEVTPTPHLAPPPKAGPGSSKAAWRAYAESLGCAVTDEMSRDEIMGLVDRG